MSFVKIAVKIHVVVHVLVYVKHVTRKHTQYIVNEAENEDPEVTITMTVNSDKMKNNNTTPPELF